MRVRPGMLIDKEGNRVGVLTGTPNAREIRRSDGSGDMEVTYEFLIREEDCKDGKVHIDKFRSVSPQGSVHEHKIDLVAAPGYKVTATYKYLWNSSRRQTVRGFKWDLINTKK